MKKGIALSVAFLLLALLIFASQWTGQNLLSQLLGIESGEELDRASSIENCKTFSESAANQCLMQLAINLSDDSVCSEISMPSDQEECRQEVALNQ